MFRHLATKLITICGSQAQAAEVVGVSQQAVGGWARGVKAHRVMEQAVRRLLLEHETRRRWIRDWFDEQAWGVTGTVITERWVERAGHDPKPAGRDEAVLRPRTRKAFCDELADRWVGWTTGVSGNFLVAWKAGEADFGEYNVREIVYLDSADNVSTRGRFGPLARRA